MKATLFPSKLPKIVEVSPSPQKPLSDPHKRVPLSSLLPHYKLLPPKSPCLQLNKAEQLTSHQNEKQIAQRKIQKMRRSLAHPNMAFENRTSKILKSHHHLQADITRMSRICLRLSILSHLTSPNILHIVTLLVKGSTKRVDKVKTLLKWILRWVSSILTTYSEMVKKKLRLDYF